MTDPRCKHDVHGKDCFKCFPTDPEQEARRIAEGAKNCDGYVESGELEADIAAALWEAREDERKFILAVENLAENTACKMLRDERDALKAERDGARRALEDRDKVCDEHIQNSEAQRLRSIAERDEARAELSRLRDGIRHQIQNIELGYPVLEANLRALLGEDRG